MGTRGLLGIGAMVALGLAGLWVAVGSDQERSPWTLPQANASVREGVDAGALDLTSPETAGPALEAALGSEPPGPPEPPGPAPEPFPDRDPDAAIAAIVALGTEWGAELDLVKPEPDPAQMERLRELTLAGGLRSSEVAAAAKGLSAGDPGRVALVLCTTWAEQPGEEVDTWLASLARPWQRGSNGEEQEALAAVLALDLGGRSEALASVAQSMLLQSGGDGDAGSFPGLTSLRAWHALRGMPALKGGAFEAFAEDWETRESDRPRVEEELWSLGVRSSLEVADRAIAEALEGHPAAITALESITDAAFVGDLQGLAQKKPVTPEDAQASAAAVKGLVAAATPESLATVQGQLGGPLVPREQALEAFRTWRRTPQQVETAAAMARLGATLAGDPSAQAAVSKGLGRCVARVRFRRSAAERRALRAALQSALEEARPAEGWADQLREWIAQLG